MITYVDTSVLVKLLVEEPESPAARAAWDGAERLVANRLLYVEAAAALAAAHRAKRVTASHYRSVCAELDDLFVEIDVIEIDHHVMVVAAGLAARHGLRGYDAAHLACAVVVDADAFATADHRLGEAASAEGLHVARLGDSRGSAGER